MSNTNWTKKDGTHSGRRDSNRPDAANGPTAPATEAELEAIRYRGAPLLRAGPPSAANHNPINPITPGGKNERTQAGTQAGAENVASEGIITQVPETPPVPGTPPRSS